MKAFVQNGYGSVEAYELVDLEKSVPSADDLSGYRVGGLHVGKIVVSVP